MSKFMCINPELRTLLDDGKIDQIEKAIEKYRISVTSIERGTQKAIFQPEGQSLVLFVDDESDFPVLCESCEVPLDFKAAKRLAGVLDENAWQYIFPLNGIEDFPNYRIDYFRQKGKSVKVQVQRHLGLIDAFLVDALVSIYHHSTNTNSLVEIYAGERFDPEYL